MVKAKRKPAETVTIVIPIRLIGETFGDVKYIPFFYVNGFFLRDDFGVSGNHIGKKIGGTAASSICIMIFLFLVYI